MFSEDPVNRSLLDCLLQEIRGELSEVVSDDLTNDSLGHIMAFLYSRFEAAARRSTDLHWYLVTAGERRELLHILLDHVTHLSWPLRALGVGGVSRGLVLTLLLHLSSALYNIILNIMFLLCCPTL